MHNHIHIYKLLFDGLMFYCDGYFNTINILFLCESSHLSKQQKAIPNENEKKSDTEDDQVSNEEQN